MGLSNNNMDRHFSSAIKKLERIAYVIEHKLVPELVRLNDTLEEGGSEEGSEEDGNQR